MINPALPPEGILDPQQPWWPTRNIGEVTWRRLKAKLTGRKDEYGTQYSSFVNLGDADADRLIENIKQYGQYPQVNQNGKDGGYSNLETYQKWLVEEFLEKPFREQTDEKIVDRQAARRIADILNKKKVQQAADLTADVIQDPWGEGTVPAKQYAVIPTTKLLPPAKEKAEEPKEVKKRGSSLVKSMTKTFARMETHFQKLTELSEVSEGNVTGIEEAFRIQSDIFVKGFQETTSLVNKIASAINLESDILVKVAKNKRNLDNKRLDAEQALAEEMQMEEQSSSSGNAQVTDFGKSGGGGPDGGAGGAGGAVGKILGGSALANLVAGKGLKKLGGVVKSKVGKKVSEVALRHALGKDAAEGISKTIGREAAEAGVEKGIGKAIGKKVPLIGLGLGAFFAAERAAKGDMLGAALELASGAASTFPGIGTGASLAIDAALIGRDAGAIPFAEGGITQKSTFTGNSKRPGVTDLSPSVFKKMYQYELDYEQKNKNKFGKVYADGYEKYFSKPSLPGILGNILKGVIEFFKNIMSRIGNFLRDNPITRALRGLTGGGYEYTDPDTGIKLTKTSDFGYRQDPFTGEMKNHGGTDISTASGTPLRALTDGQIVDSDSLGDKGWGNFLVFKDENGIYHLYGHMLDGFKRGGQVKKGDIIGKVGSTGRSTGPHLHWETGTKWNGGQLEGKFDPLSKFKIEDPFFTKRVEKPKPTPTASPTADTRQTYASQKISQNFGVQEGKRVYFPYKGEDRFYHGFKTRTGWDIYAGKAKLDTSSGKNADVVKAFLDYATNNLAYNTGELSPPDPHGVELNATGGPVKANTPIIVGDGGPELFVPKQDGIVVPNNQIAGLVDMVDRMIFGGPKKGPSTLQYGAGAPKKFRGWAADESGAEILELLGGTRVKGASLPTPAPNAAMNKLVAMAPLEDQMSNSVMVIRVNNTAPPVVIPSSDDGFEQAPSTDFFSQLHLAAIS